MGLREATKYQACLYFINAITGACGAALAGICIWALITYESAALPVWVLPFGVAFGGIVLLVSCCGCQGARSAPEHIADDTCNLPLWFYITVLLASMIIQIILAITVLTLLGTINDARSGELADTAVVKFDNDFVNWARDHPSRWIDTQNHYDCCGYSTTTGDIATGEHCADQATAVACRTKLLDKARDQTMLIGILASIFGFLELVALIASCRLLCGVHRDRNVYVSRPAPPVAYRV